MLQIVAKRSRERDRRRRMYYARLDADEATRIHGVTQETKKNEHRKKKTNRGQESSLVGSLSRVLVMCDKVQEYESARMANLNTEFPLLFSRQVNSVRLCLCYHGRGRERR